MMTRCLGPADLPVPLTLSLLRPVTTSDPEEANTRGTRRSGCGGCLFAMKKERNQLQLGSSAGTAVDTGLGDRAWCC
jgi:hypothetical protein